MVDFFVAVASAMTRLKRDRTDERVCVPRTPSLLITWPNRLTSARDDRAASLLADPVGLAVQVEEPT